MKKIGEIMEEMGFKKDAPVSSKAAFIKFLAKQAYNVDLEIPEMYRPTSEVGERSIDSLFEKKNKEAFIDSLKKIAKGGQLVSVSIR